MRLTAILRRAKSATFRKSVSKGTPLSSAAHSAATEGTGLGEEVYSASRQSIAVCFQLLARGFEAIDAVADSVSAATGFAQAFASLGNSYLAISRTAYLSPSISSAAESAGRTLWKVSDAPISQILKSGVPQLITTNTMVTRHGLGDFAWALYEAIDATNELLSGLSELRSD